SSSQGWWTFVLENNGSTRSLYLLDRGGTQPFSECPLRIQWNSTGPNYYVSPSGSTAIATSLGDPNPSLGAGYFAAAYALQYFRFSYAAAKGEWTAATYASGNFTANAGTWTVDAGDQATFAYTLVGKTMTVAFTLNGTSTSAGMGNTLKIAIPGGFTAAKTMY